jgi:hypothetical protein
MKAKELISISVLLMLSITILLKDILFFDRLYFLRDLSFLFAPWKIYTTEAIQKGELPFWAPHVYCGYPLLSNVQTAVFYPFSLLFYLFSYPQGLRLFYIVHFTILGIFAYLLLRRRFSILPSLAGTILFCFNGYVLTKIEFLSLFSQIIWLPIICSLHSSTLLSAFAVALSFLAGYPPLFIVQMFIYFIFLVYAEGWIKGIKKYLMVALLAIFFSGYQILPAVELFLTSTRMVEKIPFEVATINSFPVKGLLGIIFPKQQYFIDASCTEEPATGEKFFWATTFYLGIIGSLCLFFSFLRLRRRTLFLFLVAIIGVLLSFGRNCALSKFLFLHFPLFKYIRYPGLLLYITLCAATFQVAEGVKVMKETVKIKFAALAPFFLLFEFLCYGLNFHPTLPSQMLYINPVAKVLQKHSSYRFVISPKTMETKEFRGVTVSDAWDTMFAHLPHMLSLLYRLNNIYAYGEPLKICYYDKYIWEIFKMPIERAVEWCRFMHVKFILASSEYNIYGIKKIYKYKGVNIYDVGEVMPRVLVVEKDNIMDEGGNIFETIKAPVRSCCIQEDDREGKILIGKILGDKMIEDVEYGVQCIKVRTSKIDTYGEEIFLIMTDTYYPGWTSFVNGKKSKILKVNNCYRGVKISKSGNEVVFVYTPLLFLYGLYLFILSNSALLIRLWG